MRLALALSGKRSAASAVELARQAEDAGFAEVWLTEDYCERGAFALAGALAAATSTARIGIGVVNPWTRHSVVTAMETAALAELAPGRVVLGLGSSNPRWMQDQLGIPFERPLSVLRETTAVVRDVLSGDPVRANDGLHDVDAGLAFTPPGPIPIFLGVKGDRALRLAGDAADGVLLSVLSSPAYIRWARERVGDAHVAAYVAMSCDPDHHAARESLRAFVATFLGIHGDHPITREAGLDPELAATFRQAWLDGAPRLDLVDDGLLDTFVVAGDVDHCRSLVDRLVAAGLDTVVIHDQLQEDTASYLASVRAVVG